jgi:hypothetical protein
MEVKNEKIYLFKNYYATHPEYVAYHLNYCKSKVECPTCHKLVMRCNMTHHKRTKVHQQLNDNHENVVNVENN